VNKKSIRLIDFKDILDIAKLPQSFKVKKRTIKRFNEKIDCEFPPQTLNFVCGKDYNLTKSIEILFYNIHHTDLIQKYLMKWVFKDRMSNLSCLNHLFKSYMRVILDCETTTFPVRLIFNSSHVETFHCFAYLRKYHPKILTGMQRLINLSRFSFSIYVQAYFVEKINHNFDALYASFNELLNSDDPTLRFKMIDDPVAVKLTQCFLEKNKSSGKRYIDKHLFLKLMTITSFLQVAIYDEEHTEENNLELVNYHINSSHNTYLKHYQYGGVSLPDPYRYALLNGARCIEIDVYDPGLTDDQNMPIVIHTKVLRVVSCPLLPVLEAIRDTAFVASPLPITISFENHCKLPYQNIIANFLIEIFGEIMMMEKEFDERTANGQKLTLKDCHNRIFIKNKNSKEVDPLLASCVSYYKPKKLDSKGDLNQQLSDIKFHFVWSMDENEAFFVCNKQQVIVQGQSNSAQASAIETESPTDLTPQMMKVAKNASLRIYPKSLRMQSSNYNPASFYTVGFQMVALNFQTPDFRMSLNRNLFYLNQNRGYFLRSRITRNPSTSDLNQTKPPELYFQLKIISFITKYQKGQFKIFIRSFKGPKVKYEFKTKHHFIKSNPAINYCVTLSKILYAETSNLQIKFKTDNGRKYQLFAPLFAINKGLSFLVLNEINDQAEPIILLVKTDYIISLHDPTIKADFNLRQSRLPNRSKISLEDENQEQSDYTKIALNLFKPDLRERNAKFFANQAAETLTTRFGAKSLNSIVNKLYTERQSEFEELAKSLLKIDKKIEKLDRSMTDKSGGNTGSILTLKKNKNVFQFSQQSGFNPKEMTHEDLHKFSEMFQNIQLEAREKKAAKSKFKCVSLNENALPDQIEPDKKVFNIKSSSLTLREEMSKHRFSDSLAENDSSDKIKNPENIETDN